MAIESDVQKLDLGVLIEMYVLDLTIIGGEDVFYFHPGVNGLDNDLTWQGIVYSRWPLEAKGFELSGRGTLPRPSVQVANIDGSIGLLCATYADMVGACLTRKRTLGKYLDVVNFAGGVNPTADPTAQFPDEVYFIQRKVDENPIFISFELTANWDVSGVMLPGRPLTRNGCPWIYRGAECSYTGSSYFDINDDSVGTLAEDVCAKRLISCKKRFGLTAELPYGGIPGAAQ